MSDINPDPRRDPEEDLPPDDARMKKVGDDDAGGMPQETIDTADNEPGSQAPPAQVDPEGDSS